ncbi:MAG TPA: DUF1156 domain-containing protein, partial [Blastocatellia bacterium]|nr:DUF1156 domain-containing protein [Blastocatellia bacterium]
MSKIPAKTKKERIAEAAAKAVGAGRKVAISTVDFNDPFRPKTCLEVDFPILPINQIASIEGNAGKPIYQMSKWWARRRSSVFRAILIAAAMKAPDDPAEAAKAVWDVYYANHQAKGALKHLKVADIFMGGGTTIVEGSRLGMQMYGNDLNPVAWFIVKNELAKVDPEEVKALLDDIEAEVKPQIMPFYACDCPRGHKGKWAPLSANKVMGADFDPLRLTPENRKDYRYEGPEVIYVFWAKHGKCQMTGCGHRTPIMSSPVIAIKTLSVRAWENYGCGECGKKYDVEAQEARMAPGAPLVVAEAERPYALLDAEGHVSCPHCGRKERFTRISGKAKNKKIELSLLAHPQWLRGSPKRDGEGREFGGSATDSAETTAAWNQERARQMRLVEARGALPPEITCPETAVTFRTDKGTVPKKSNFACGSCGAAQDVLEAIKATGKTGPLAAYAIQGYCPECDGKDELYGGRFFIPVNDTSGIDAANQEWSERSESDLKNFWPRSELPFGFMTHLNNGGLPNHGFTHWWKMFNARQLLLHTQLLRAILNAGAAQYEWITREFVLGAFQQYLRNQSLFTLWNAQRDTPEPMFSNNNYHPKATMIENSVFSAYGRGNWASCVSALQETIDWKNEPWEIVSHAYLESRDSTLAAESSGKSEKVFCNDGVIANVTLQVASSTELNEHSTESLDLVITDPPFGGLLHYSELSDFFHVWLRLALKDRYPEYFSAEYTPKMLEAVANRARRDDPDAFYRRLLTECWREAHRILKPGGILAFTFHHSEDEPWVAVLESLFDAGFYLEATYPIRSDETKGAGAKPGTFGSQKIEYDIVHVCRKRVCRKRVCDERAREPHPVSWGRMRREV